MDPLSDKYPSMSPYAYCANNPVILVDPDGESPVKAILSAVKISHKLYKIYKKTGKITSKSLKNAGLEEFIDIGGDIQTIFSGDATVLDRINAVADLIIGTDLNNKGQKAVKNILEKDNNSKLRKTNPSKAESKIWNDFKPFKKNIKTSGEGKERRYYQWDHTHNDIEVYNFKGEHQGSMDPTTGDLYKKNVSGRRLKF